jgi:cis-3-alkyl-4-acyloxetan-2-one decarboxylase
VVTIDRDLYPFESNFFDTGAAQLHYLDEGEGEPVVMVHGNPSWSFYYRDVVQALRGTHRCIVPDHVGCGLSEKPGDDDYEYTLGSRVDDLTALLDRLEPDRQITLILHDWGGAIGMAWAVRHPQRVKRIVLLNTGAFRNPADQSLPPSLWLVRNTPLGSLLVRGFNAFSAGATRMAVVNKMDPKVRAAYVAPYDNWTNRIATLRFVQDIPLTESDAAFSVVVETENGLEQFRETPILICWGEQDFVFDDAFLTEWERRLPNAEVHRYPDAGHYVLEDAGSDIIPRIQRFLS